MTQTIPLEKIQTGINQAKKLGLRHLEDARILLKNTSIEGATILTTYGLEELGRILILQERSMKAKEEGLDYIILRSKWEDDFYNHEAKQKIALQVLPENANLLHVGDFGEGFGRGFDIDIFISQELREDLNFVDYVDGYWTNPVKSIDVDKLANCIVLIEKAIKKRI